MATVQGIAAATSRITVGTGSAELVVSGYVTPHFKGGLRQVVDALDCPVPPIVRASLEAHVPPS